MIWYNDVVPVFVVIQTEKISATRSLMVRECLFQDMHTASRYGSNGHYCHNFMHFKAWVRLNCLIYLTNNLQEYIY